MSLELVNGAVATCSRAREVCLEMDWVPEANYVAGTQVELRAYRLRSFVSWRYTRHEMDGADVVWRWPSRPSISDRMKNPSRALMRSRLTYGARKGVPMRIRMYVIPAVWSGVDEHFSLWTQDAPNNFAPDAKPPEAVQEKGSVCHVPAVPGPVDRLGVYAQPAPGPDGSIRVVITPLDCCGNPTAFVHPVEAECQWIVSDNVGRASAPSHISVHGVTSLNLPAPNAPVARLTVRISMQSLALNENIGNGTKEAGRASGTSHIGAGSLEQVTSHALLVTSNPVWTTPPQGQIPAFGEFHWHTDFSGDGQRPIEEAIRCAREELNHDFTAPSDHNPTGAAWQQTVEALDKANDPGRFATFYGWESGGNVGHENFYFTDPNHPMICSGTAQVWGGRPDQYIDKLKPHQGFIAIPHHTNAVAETRKLEDDSPYWHPYPWTAPTHAHRLAEIIQCRGNQECNQYTDDWLGWHQHNGASVQDALRLGYKVGFTGGTDNHCGWPGRAYADSEGPLMPPWTQSVTGVWARAVERQAVWDGLRARHTWAVVNTRALVWFTVNDAPAGDEIVAKAGALLTARIRLSAEDSLKSVEIVSEGQTVWAKLFDELDVDVTVDLGKAEKPTHFYLRALQRNGGILYASPVFVEVKS